MDSTQIVSFLEHGGMGIGVFLALMGIWFFNKKKKPKSKTTQE